jgi:mRNA interferase HigB
MNIHNKSKLIDFYIKHGDCKETLEKWYHDVSTLEWKKPSDVVKDFNTARTIKNSRAIFEINKNDYRLIIEVQYQKGWVFIKFIGTHPQYDKIDPETVEQFKPRKK